MAVSGIRENSFTNVNCEVIKKQSNISNESIFNFVGNDNDFLQDDISQGKIKTEMFIEEIMNKLDSSKSNDETTKYYLGKLINIVQKLNGVQENNLKPQGDSKQNSIYEQRIKELKYLLNDYVNFVGSGLNVMQDAKGLYKLTINDKSYDVPSRKVELRQVETEDGVELELQFVD